MKRIAVDRYEVLKADDAGKVQYFIDGVEQNLEEIEATHEDRKRLLMVEVMLEQVM
jgi:hypothetical protein